ncbi:YbjN domain-containing protein [Psychrobacter sp. CAL346-MNA-CIBAN-0220]|uniref:YbjN domain-containing protein n=1 Tax=Psychrobacter sp. CAL346-MNA-CIBAN-0220 TaxID=3140457 RepID=UPI00332F6496
MSPHDKRSFWQKIKRLLTPSASRSVIDETDARGGSLRVDVSDKKTDTSTDIVNKGDSVSTSDADLSDSSDTQKRDLDGKNFEGKNSQDPTFNSDNSKNIAPNKSNDTPIVDYLKQYLHKRQWHYTYYRPNSSDSQQSHHLSLRMKNKQIDCGYLFRVQESNRLLAVYGILPFLIPESHQSAAMLLITQINYDMLVGNLEMDVNDGEIRYKNAIDVEAVGINDDITEHLLQSVIAMTTVTYEIFSDLINTQEPAEDMPTLLGELRQQADARTFFLATQKMQ